MNAFFAAIGQAITTFVNFLSNPYVQATLFVAQGIQSHRTNKKLKRGQDILLTKFGTGGGIPVVYGTRRVAGTVVFMETVANKELFVVYALAVGEVEKISDLKIDGRSIGDRSVYRDGFVLREEGNYFGGTVASENTVDIGNVLGGAGGDNPRMVFNLHHGATDQEADPMLFHVFDGTNSRPNSWSADHKLSGIAYIAANYEYDTRGMFTGIPNLTAVVKGKKVLDTRTSTTGWSDNPALILHDYLTNDEYGKGIATANIDTTSFNTAANACEADVQTESYTNVTVLQASTSDDTFEISDEAVFDKIKIGSTINFVANSVTYFSGKVVDKDDSNFLYDEADDYGRTFFITLAEGSVTTAITSGTTGTITEVQDRFETNAVIDTDETVLENTKDLIANMRGIFTYTNGTYAIKVEGTETPVLNLDEDDILETGLQLAIENKEQKYNKVEVEFYNSSKNYEADTVVAEHSPLSDDGGEVLEHRVQFPHVTNQRIAYNHANAILNRSRNNRSIAFVATPKVLKANVGEVITITSSDLDLSQEQYRITQMTIQPDLNIQVAAVEYQGSIYGWNNPPAEVIARPVAPPDPYRVEAPTNFNFNQKSGSTPAFLSWDDATAYPSYEFSVKVYDATNQGGNVIRDGRVKEARFYLPELPKANGYSAEVISINTLSIESDPTPLNSFDVTVDPVITEDIAQGAVGGFKFTGSKMYHPVDGSDTGTFEISNVYIDDAGQFSLKDKLSFDGTDLNVQGDITSGSTITGATITIDTSASIRKFKASTSLVQIGSGIDEPQLRINTGNVTNALTFASESGEDGDKVSFALDNGGTITEKAFIKTDTGNASFQNLTFNGNLISGSTTVLTSARQLQNIASLDATTTSTIQSAVGSGTTTTINNNADNRVITGSNTADTLNGEANLTFDGSTLGVTGAITATGNIQTNGTTHRFGQTATGANSITLTKGTSSASFFEIEDTFKINATIGETAELIYNTTDENDVLKFINYTADVLTLDSANNATFTGTISSKTILISSATGTYQAGALGYSDSNWGFLYRPPQAGALGAHLFEATNGADLLKIEESGNATFAGAISSGAITSTGDISIPVAKSLYFGGGSHTYIREDIDDRLRFFVGGAEFMRFTEDTTDTTNFYTNATFAGNIELSKNDPVITLNDSGTSSTITGQSGNILYKTSSTNRDHVFYGVNNEKFRVTGDGILQVGSSQTTILTADRQLQNIASLDATTTTTIENAISTSFTGGTITSDLVLSGTGTGVIVVDNFELNATGNNGQITYNLDDEGDSYFRFVRYDVEKLRIDTDVDLKTNLHMNGTEIITTSRSLTNIGTISAAAITTSAANQDFDMAASVVGQIVIDGNAYTGGIALGSSTMAIYHNSSSRSLTLGTNETARITIGGAGGVSFNNNAISGISTISSGAITSTGNLLLDSSNAEINIKSGVGGTTGAVNWTFNTTGTNYAAIKLPYDTRASTGLHIDSGYPITIDATTNTDFDISGSTKMRLNATGLGIGTTAIGEKLTVAGSIKSTARAIGGSSTAGVTLSYDSSNSIAKLETWTSKPFSIETAGVERMRIDGTHGDLTLISSFSGGTNPLRIGYGSYASYTTVFQIDDNGNVSLKEASQTGGNKIHMPRAGGITFYGDESEHHGIFSRNNTNVEADDILITSYGAFYIDLDSNNNNGSGADFIITRHNSTSLANTIFQVNGENKQATFYGHAVPSQDDEHDLGTNSLRWRNLNVGDIQLNNTGSGGNEVDGTEGRWTIQEGADDLFLINRNTNRKYRFKLEEV